MKFGFAAPEAPKTIGGTSGHPRHTKLTRYRCSLPGLAGFAGNRCTEPEVPPISRIFSRRRESSTRHLAAKQFAAQRWGGGSLPARFGFGFSVLPCGSREKKETTRSANSAKYFEVTDYSGVFACVEAGLFRLSSSRT